MRRRMFRSENSTAASAAAGNAPPVGYPERVQRTLLSVAPKARGSACPRCHSAREPKESLPVRTLGRSGWRDGRRSAVPRAGKPKRRA